MNANQSQWLLTMSANGWVIKKIEMTGEKLWFVVEKIHPTAKNIFLNKDIYGIIGQKGKIEAEYQQFMYREKVTSGEQLARLVKDV